MKILSAKEIAIITGGTRTSGQVQYILNGEISQRGILMAPLLIQQEAQIGSSSIQQL